MSRGRLLTIFSLALLVLVAAWWLALTWAGPLTPSPLSEPIGSLPPLSHPVQIEVLNASGIPGLARTATQRLREAGLDVVYYGNSSQPGDSTGDSTVVLIRSGDTTGLGRILSVVGPTQVEVVGPENRWVAFSVLLGRVFNQPDQDRK